MAVGRLELMNIFISRRVGRQSSCSIFLLFSHWLKRHPVGKLHQASLKIRCPVLLLFFLFNDCSFSIFFFFLPCDGLMISPLCLLIFLLISLWSSSFVWGTSQHETLEQDQSSLTSTAGPLAGRANTFQKGLSIHPCAYIVCQHYFSATQKLES